MQRIHNTTAKEIILSARPAQQKTGLKPSGLWYGINNSWAEWCKTEMPHWIRPNDFELIIDTNNILFLYNYSDLHDFTGEYGEQLGGFLGDQINWKMVADKYKGIEIPNYLWDGRFDFFWYYGWDCASGCIWDLSAVTQVNILTEKIEQC